MAFGSNKSRGHWREEENHTEPLTTGPAENKAEDLCCYLLLF